MSYLRPSGTVAEHFALRLVRLHRYGKFHASTITAAIVRDLHSTRITGRERHPVSHVGSMKYDVSLLLTQAGVLRRYRFR